MQARDPAAVLCRRIRAFIAAQEQSELSDVHVVHTTADLCASMPPYVAAFLESRLA
jgi:hypothetical protein